jgi:hypothetical protein
MWKRDRNEAAKHYAAKFPSFLFLSLFLRRNKE